MMSNGSALGRYIHPRERRPSWKLDSNYSGPVYVWDLDSTYLATESSTLWDLVKTAFESPASKKNISGTVSLIKHLQSGEGDDLHAPLFFVSASPPQMRKKILAKLRLDGVRPTEIYFKDQWDHMKRGEFSMLRKHVGYKLLSLIYLWFHLPRTAVMILFGDDKESDALTYSLFSDICSQRLQGRQLIYLLRDIGLRRQEATVISYWQRSLPQLDPVKRAYIHLISGSDPEYYRRFSPIVRPTRCSLQIALYEYGEGRLGTKGVSAVAYEMHIQGGMSQFRMRKYCEEFLHWGQSNVQLDNPIWDLLLSQHLIDERPSLDAIRSQKSEGVGQDPIPSSNEELKIRMKYYHEIV